MLDSGGGRAGKWGEQGVPKVEHIHTGRRVKEGSAMGGLPSACLEVARKEAGVSEDADEDGEVGQASKQATVLWPGQRRSPRRRWLSLHPNRTGENVRGSGQSVTGYQDVNGSFVI